MDVPDDDDIDALKRECKEAIIFISRSESTLAYEGLVSLTIEYLHRTGRLMINAPDTFTDMETP